MRLPKLLPDSSAMSGATQSTVRGLSDSTPKYTSNSANAEHSVGGGATRAAEHGCPSELRRGCRDSRQHAPDPVRAKILVLSKDHPKENYEKRFTRAGGKHPMIANPLR